MNNFSLKNLVVPRIPRLYYGPDQYVVEKSGRARLADGLFLGLQVLSLLLFIIGGLVGYFVYQMYGSLVLAMLGYLGGVWMRRSLGIRRQKATTGFFARLRERAQGSRPGLLEMLLEGISQNPLTLQKCRMLVQTYERAVKQLKQTKTLPEQNKILAELDRRVQQIYWQIKPSTNKKNE
jgi:hypothetical protein